MEQKVRQVQRLQGYDIDVPVDEVLAEAQGVPGRVHIATWRCGGIPGALLTLTTCSASFWPPMRPNSVYVRREFSLSVFDAIALTHAAGGLAVLAHPGSYVRIRDIDSVIERLALAGLDGLEVRYTYGQNRGHKGASPAAVAQVVSHFDALADACGLFKTGGSDYHGTTKPGIEIGQAGLTEREWEIVNDRLTIGNPPSTIDH